MTSVRIECRTCDCVLLVCSPEAQPGPKYDAAVDEAHANGWSVSGAICPRCRVDPPWNHEGMCRGTTVGTVEEPCMFGMTRFTPWRTTSRCEYPRGWNLVTNEDPVGRRGFWIRTVPKTPLPREGRLLSEVVDGMNGIPLSVIELCSGREGDDAYVRFEVGETITAEMLHYLEHVISRVAGAHEDAVDHKHENLAKKRLHERRNR